MTKIEIIEKKIEKDQITLTKLRRKKHEVEKARIEKWTEMYSRYFKDAIMEGDEIEVSDSYVYFKRFKEDYNYHKEIISLNVRAKSWRDDEADSIETSFYSTNDNSDYELKRMITIGSDILMKNDFRPSCWHRARAFTPVAVGSSLKFTRHSMHLIAPLCGRPESSDTLDSL